MPSIEEHKQRVLSTRGNVNEDKLRHSELITNNGNLAGTIDILYIDEITPQQVNEYLHMVINVPTVLAKDRYVRWLLLDRTSYYIGYHSDIIDQEVKEVLEQYFDWLKERDDYDESPEEKEMRIEKERIMARCKIISKELRSELIETLYHPDRYMKMVASYGEVWADVHLPY
jgi:hypothetical protein